MKPNQQQKQLLQKYLCKGLKYRETYEEVYDHILAALENKSLPLSFGDAVNYIIREDFGGMNGIALMEAQYQKSTMKEMQKKYLTYIIEYLKFPQTGILVIYSIIVYCLVKQPWFNLLIFGGVFFILRIIPRLLKTIRYFKKGYILRDTKRSVKDRFFSWLDYIPALLFCFFILFTPGFYKGLPLLWLKNIDSFFITIFFVIYSLHALSCFKLYKYDLRTKYITR